MICLPIYARFRESQGAGSLHHSVPFFRAHFISGDSPQVLRGPCERAAQLYIYHQNCPSQVFPPPYLPCCEDGAHKCRSSSEASCIAQRGEALLWLSFGAASGAIFGGLHSSVYLTLLSSVFVGLVPMTGEGFHLPLSSITHEQSHNG